MYIKENICSFVQSKVEYFGHFIFASGVETNPRKVATVAKMAYTIEHERVKELSWLNWILSLSLVSL